MRAIWTIAWKDMRNLIKSPLYYIIAGLCTILWSYSYIRNLLMFAEQTRTSLSSGVESGKNLQLEVFMQHISQINLILIFVVPALTMRLLAEEKRLRTYDLLLTSPITATQIALGKFIAGLGAMGGLLLISFLYPLVTRGVAEFPMLPLLSAYLGLFMVAGTYVAVGMFASSLTDSIVLSVIMGLIFNIMLWFIGQGAGSNLPQSVTTVLEYMAIGQHFVNFILGSIKLKSVVFLVSLMALFVFLTQRVVETSRWR
jgi:ABC-2 type transport system permease protein